MIISNLKLKLFGFIVPNKEIGAKSFKGFDKKTDIFHTGYTVRMGVLYQNSEYCLGLMKITSCTRGPAV